ncbi:MAG: hypothetical protein U0N18_02995, partial [Acidaminococcus intestini]
VGYPGIYLGGFQIRMPQKTAYGLDGHTVREQHGGGVRMPGHMIGQPYLETALPAKFLQYGGKHSINSPFHSKNVILLL